VGNKAEKFSAFTEFEQNEKARAVKQSGVSVDCVTANPAVSI
jgi:hypothetical protein